MGELNVFNTGAGDIKISFDTNNHPEAIRAKRIITDMLKRGYALLVQLPDGTYTRAKKFDEKTGEYIIADFDNVEAAKHDEKEQQKTETAGTWIKGGKQQKKPGAGKEKRVAMEKSKVHAVAPSAGG